MTAAPVWLNDVVSAFGRQMGLKEFHLAENGAAAIRFENGIHLALEYAEGTLTISTGIECRDDLGSLERLFASAFWAAQRGETVRAAYLAKAGRGICLVRLPERAVTLTRLESAFRAVWEKTEAFRRVVA